MAYQNKCNKKGCRDFSKSTISLDTDISINGDNISRIAEFKYLRVYLDSEFN